MADRPIVCSLTPDALEARRSGLLAGLVTRATDRAELPDGLRFQFVADSAILGELARTVEAERRCCRFLQFTITVSPDGGPVGLEMTGPAGTREFLAALFD